MNQRDERDLRSTRRDLPREWTQAVAGAETEEGIQPAWRASHQACSQWLSLLLAWRSAQAGLKWLLTHFLLPTQWCRPGNRRLGARKNPPPAAQPLMKADGPFGGLCSKIRCLIF